MNTITPIKADVDDDAWDRAFQATSTWRGHALQCFAQAEAAVSEALLAMAAVPERGANTRLRPLVGQRFEDLRAAVDDQGPFSLEGGKAASALARFRQHEPLRAFLSHGVTKVALDRQGRWLVVLKLLAFRARAEERLSRTLEEREAEDLLSKLKADTKHLASALQSLRARLKT